MIYGSLAKTGKGHMTDKAIIKVLSPVPIEIEFITHADFILPHPNTIDFLAYKDGRQTTSMRVVSVGGGDIVIDGREEMLAPDIYKENTFAEISSICKANNISLSEYIEQCEGKKILGFLYVIWDAMKHSINEALTSTGIL
ncbi:L-serine dehydratase TdcG [Clostridium sp. BL-8]|nr:L-serine dehydratase TdcG [Clostridium sp. BL-8]